MSFFHFLHPLTRRSSSSFRSTLRNRRHTNPPAQRRFWPVLEALEDRTVFATHFLVSGLPAVITAGTPFNITVTAQNAYNTTDTGYLGTVQFTSSDGRGLLPADSGLANGVGTFGVTLFTAGAQSITATDNANGNISGQANFVVDAAATVQFLLSGLTSPVTAGVAGTISVTAADVYGNQTSGYKGVLHFTSSDVQAVLPADHSLSHGTGTFSVTLETAGAQTLVATDTLNSAITGNLGAIPQTAAVYTQAPSPAGGGVKSAWYAPGGQGMDGDQYVWDAFVLGSNQPISEIHWRGFYAYAAYNSPNIPSCPVSDFTISIYPTSPYPGVNEPNIFAQPIAQYSVGSNAGETPAGTAGGMPMYDYAFTLPSPFQATAGTKYWLQIEASQGVAPQTAWPPDWSIAFGTGGDNSHFYEIVGGTLAGGNLYSLSSGDAAFSLVGYTNAPGVIVNPAATSRFHVTGFASPTTAGMAGDVTVTAEDPYGNVTPSYKGAVHLTSSDARAVLPADARLTNGVGTFRVKLDTAGTQSLTATDTVASGLHGTQSGIAVRAANAYRMTTTAVPPAVPQGMSEPLTITLQDFYGNVATSYTGTVTFSSTDPHPVLPADYTFLAADKGTRTFSVTLNTLGTWSLSAHDTLTSSLSANQSSIQVFPPIRLGSLSFGEWTATRGGYGGTIPVSGGAGGYTGLSVRGLPAGLRAGLSGSSVLLGGTPLAAGKFPFTVALHDRAGIGASQSFTLIVEPSSTLVWTGHGGDNRWSDAANWSGAAPVAGNVLDFGPGTLQKTAVNDFAPGTLFRSILFEDSGYTLKGNAIGLSGGINVTSPVAGTDSVALGIGLAANQTITVGRSAVLQVQGLIGGGTFGITKAGAGTLVYTGSAANTYTGATTVHAGVMQLDKSGGNAIAGPLTVGRASVLYGGHNNQIADTAVVTVGVGGTLGLNGHSDKVAALVLNGGGVATGTGTLILGGDITSNAAAATATISGNLDLGGLTRTVMVAHGTAVEDLLLEANIRDGGITKTGSGALVLAGNNTYAGRTTVSAGVLDVRTSTALGSTAGGTAVAAGATLEVESGNGLAFTESLTLGTPNDGGGTLLMLGGSTTWAGKMALAATSTINVAAGQLNLGRVLSGSGGVTKVGAGTLVYGGSAANTYTGPTTVSGGQLQLNDARGNAIAGPLTVGAGASVLYGGHNNQIADTAVVTVGVGGTLGLNGHSDKVAALVLNGGGVATGTGTLILGGDITSNAAAATATISGNLDLGGLTRTVTVAPGSAIEQLVISANIRGGGLTKAGTGALVLSGNNTYTGLTTVSAGVLDVRTSTALGSTAGGTAVAAGATLEIEGTGLTVNEALTLGKGTTGATLRVLGGSNSWAGNISLAGVSTIHVGAGQLTLGGNISGGGGLNKTGSGTLLVNGSRNSFAGLTTVSAGTLGGTGKVGPVTVNGGAHLAPGSAGPGTLTSSNVSFSSGSAFDLVINGITAGTDYDQLASTGTVALGGARLNVSLGNFTPSSGSNFTIITRSRADVGNSTFAGLAEGATFTAGSFTFRISYVGGVTHHDVVLTVL